MKVETLFAWLDRAQHELICTKQITHSTARNLTKAIIYAADHFVFATTFNNALYFSFGEFIRELDLFAEFDYKNTFLYWSMDTYIKGYSNLIKFGFTRRHKVDENVPRGTL